MKLPAIHNAGLPDRLCLFPGGEVVFVELKAFGKKPRTPSSSTASSSATMVALYSYRLMSPVFRPCLLRPSKYIRN